MLQSPALKTATALTALVTFLRSERYHFVTPTPATHDRVNSRPANARARQLTDVFGWSRPFARSLLPAALFSALRDEAVISAKDDAWMSDVRVSTLQGELLVHSAFPTRSADAVFLGPDTYRFARAIRNNLCEEPRRFHRVLDIGCGTGAGAIVASKNAKCDELLMIDINENALRLAQVNAYAAGVRATALFSDLFANIAGTFDFIVANPPYLNDPLQRAYRHGGGSLGSALSVRIAEAAIDKLAQGGTLLLYTGSPIVDGNDLFLQAVERCFRGGDLLWSYEEVDPDVFGEELETELYRTVDRIAAVVLIARKPGVHEC